MVAQWFICTSSSELFHHVFVCSSRHPLFLLCISSLVQGALTEAEFVTFLLNFTTSQKKIEKWLKWHLRLLSPLQHFRTNPVEHIVVSSFKRFFFLSSHHQSKDSTGYLLSTKTKGRWCGSPTWEGRESNLGSSTWTCRSPVGPASPALNPVMSAVS